MPLTKASAEQIRREIQKRIAERLLDCDYPVPRPRVASCPNAYGSNWEVDIMPPGMCGDCLHSVRNVVCQVMSQYELVE